MSVFNLATDPWVQATRTDHGAVTLSLADVFAQADTLTTIAGPAPVAAAVTRLLIAVLRDALGHGQISQAQWDEWWDAGLPADRVLHYLQDHADALRLHGPRPFMQDATLAEQGRGGAWKSASELRPDIPSGENPVLYAHYTDLGEPRPYTPDPAEAARWLIATQSFVRPGIFPGLVTPRASGRGGTLLSRLVVIPQGPTLAHTLLLSLPLGARDPQDLPPWRRHAPVIAAPVPGPVSYLTWQSRHILLAAPADGPGGGTIRAVKVAACDDPDPLIPRTTQAQFDPHLIFTPSPNAADGLAIAEYRPSQAAWRDAAAIAAFDGAAFALTRARTILAAHPGTRVTVETYGLAVQSTAKFVDTERRSIPLPATPGALAGAQQIAQLAARGERAVRTGALAFLTRIGHLSATSLVGVKVAAADTAALPYWNALNDPAGRITPLLESASDQDARKALIDGFAEHVVHAARSALGELRDAFGAGPAATVAHAAALHTLRAALRPDNTTEQATPHTAAA